MPVGSSEKLINRQAGVAGPVMLLCCLLFSAALSAQQQGPLNIPPPASPPQQQPSKPPAPASNQTSQASSPVSQAPPSVPVDQVIKEFAAHEAEFRTERDNFTYTQTFVVQTIGYGDQPDGEYRLTSDIIFTPDGQRLERITDAPAPTLTRISLSEQDLQDLRNIQPFVLTTNELPKYNITYVGREKVDELDTYVFDVAPKKIEKDQRYFQGRIWVEDTDLEIVKTDGKAVPDIIKGSSENLFPRFQTYRENIEGHYWFPVYTYSDDVLPFRTGAVHMRMTVQYSNYKRFRVSVKLINPNQPNQPAQPHPQQ